MKTHDEIDLTEFETLRANGRDFIDVKAIDKALSTQQDDLIKDEIEFLEGCVSKTSSVRKKLCNRIYELKQKLKSEVTKDE